VAPNVKDAPPVVGTEGAGAAPNAKFEPLGTG